MMFKRLGIILVMLMLGACSLPAPKYSPSYDNVQLLKNANDAVETSAFTGATEGVGNISLRGNTLTSPYDKDFVYYIQYALEQELEKAGLLVKGSNKKLAAIIEKNDIETGSSVAKGFIEATFVISQSGSEIYRNHVEIEEEWESSFIGAVAIPKAAEMYPTLVRSLLHKLYSDETFIAAINK